MAGSLACSPPNTLEATLEALVAASGQPDHARRARLRATTPAPVTTQRLRTIITEASSLTRLLVSADPARRGQLYAWWVSTQSPAAHTPAGWSPCAG